MKRFEKNSLRPASHRKSQDSRQWKNVLPGDIPRKPKDSHVQQERDHLELKDAGRIQCLKIMNGLAKVEVRPVIVQVICLFIKVLLPDWDLTEMDRLLFNALLEFVQEAFKRLLSKDRPSCTTSLAELQKMDDEGDQSR